MKPLLQVAITVFLIAVLFGQARMAAPGAASGTHTTLPGCRQSTATR